VLSREAAIEALTGGHATSVLGDADQLFRARVAGERVIGIAENREKVKIAIFTLKTASRVILCILPPSPGSADTPLCAPGSRLTP